MISHILRWWNVQVALQVALQNLHKINKALRLRRGSWTSALSPSRLSYSLCFPTETCRASLPCLWARCYNTSLNLIRLHSSSRVNLRCTGAAVLRWMKDLSACEPVCLCGPRVEAVLILSITTLLVELQTNQKVCLDLVGCCSPASMTERCCNTLHEVRTNRKNPIVCWVKVDTIWLVKTVPIVHSTATNLVPIHHANTITAPLVRVLTHLDVWLLHFICILLLLTIAVA